MRHTVTFAEASAADVRLRILCWRFADWLPAEALPEALTRLAEMYLFYTDRSAPVTKPMLLPMTLANITLRRSETLDPDE